jgi:hypothetical protein
LTQVGHDVVVWDRAPDVGGVWSATRRYPDVTTQSPRERYSLSAQELSGVADRRPAAAVPGRLRPILQRRCDVPLRQRRTARRAIAEIGDRLFCHFTILVMPPDGPQLALPCVTVVQPAGGLIIDYRAPALRAQV